MNRITREAKTGCRQIRVTSGTGPTGARLYRSAFRGIEPVVPRRRRPAPGGPRLRGSGQDTGRPGAIRGRNLADGGSPWRKVAEPGRRPEPRHAWSGPISADDREAPPAGFEPAHTAPEAVALSPELWGLAHRCPGGRGQRGLSKDISVKVLWDTCSICERRGGVSR